MGKKLKIGVVGLRFGAEFPMIYRDHPDVEKVVICDTDETLLRQFGDKLGFADRCADFDALLATDVDAVHIVTNIHSHAALAVRALDAGKDVACTVPMATTLAELRDIMAAKARSGRRYMMMETAVYTFQFLHMRELSDAGRVGRIQYMRGTHFQDMEGWPDYWQGLPPMHYATHAVAPLLHLSGARAQAVRCFGSGTMREELVRRYGNPFPVETAIFTLDRPGLVAEVTRSLFETAHEYVEGFTILADKLSFEMNFENEAPILYEFAHAPGAREDNRRGRVISRTAAECPDTSARLPEPIRKYTRQHTVLDPNNPHQSIKQGGGHHGSHPHMVHEFVRSIAENREPAIHAALAANWTAAGICAHESALQNGALVEIPVF